MTRRAAWWKLVCAVIGHGYGRVTDPARGPWCYVPVEQCPRCGQIWYP